MKHGLLLPFFLLLGCCVFGQTDPNYVQAVDIALGELQKGQCKPCLEAYDRGFAISKHSALSSLRAAQCAQLCGDATLANTYAAQALEISWNSTYNVLSELGNYPEINPLRQSALGKKTLEDAHAKGIAVGYNFELSKALDALRAEDQQYRGLLRETLAKHGEQSPEYQKLMQACAIGDSICLLKAEAIIKQYGYPGKTMVGGDRQDIVWSVIQHAPLAKQEQYFPILEAAAEKGELNKSALAYLVDRIRVGKGQPQLYGSQVEQDKVTGAPKFCAIEDEANVNKRRAEMGLKPLEEYAARMGINWTPK